MDKQEKIAIREAKAQAHRMCLAQLPDFKAFGKISRLNRDIIITEKIDGTNAAIGVTEDGRVYAQSRSRIITPFDDNYGFADWVEKNSEVLRELGAGVHFGEWWGLGVNRGYGLTERRFSLFNVSRWADSVEGLMRLSLIHRRGLTNIKAVPVLYRGPWTFPSDDLDEVFFAPEEELHGLDIAGSRAAPGYMNPEGIVVYHSASDYLFKATIKKDEAYKGGKRDEHGNTVKN